MNRTTRGAIDAMHPTVFSFIAFAIAIAMTVFISNAVRASLAEPDVAFKNEPISSSTHLLAAGKSNTAFR